MFETGDMWGCDLTAKVGHGLNVACVNNCQESIHLCKITSNVHMRSDLRVVVDVDRMCEWQWIEDGGEKKHNI